MVFACFDRGSYASPKGANPTHVHHLQAGQKYPPCTITSRRSPPRACSSVLRISLHISGLGPCQRVAGETCTDWGTIGDRHAGATLQGSTKIETQAGRQEQENQTKGKTPERENRTPICPEVPWTEAMSRHQPDSPRHPQPLRELGASWLKNASKRCRRQPHPRFGMDKLLAPQQCPNAVMRGTTL